MSNKADASQISRIELSVTYSPAAILYGFFTPTITINGYKQRRPWGTHFLDLPPGNYEVAVSYPWLWWPECGRNSVVVTLAPGEIKRITYCAGLIRFIPGEMTVSSYESR